VSSAPRIIRKKAMPSIFFSCIAYLLPKKPHFCFFISLLLMRVLFIAIILVFLHNSTVLAQSKLHIGYFVNPTLNLYQRTHQPKASSVIRERSSGQVLNVLPDIAAGIWVGKPHKWAVGLETGIAYHLFAFNLQDNIGMGALNIPLLLRGFIPLVSNQGAKIYLNVATGLQWNKTEFSARKTALMGSNDFFVTYCIEAAAGIAAVSQKQNQIRGLDLFFRTGFGTGGALSFQTGLRLNFWNAFFKK